MSPEHHRGGNHHHHRSKDREEGQIGQPREQQRRFGVVEGQTVLHQGDEIAETEGVQQRDTGIRGLSGRPKRRVHGHCQDEKELLAAEKPTG
jgi:hypothetical protein